MKGEKPRNALLSADRVMKFLLVILVFIFNSVELLNFIYKTQKTGIQNYLDEISDRLANSTTTRIDINI